MKIVIDTEEIKQKLSTIWGKLTAENVFLGSVILVLSGYIISNKVGSLFNKTDSCCVEVTLEKPETPWKEDTFPRKTKISQLYNVGEKLYLSDKEFNCLARNIYWEAMHEPLIGQISVAHVTYNRVFSKKWGDTFCEVIFEPKQFSWTNNKKIRVAVPKNKTQWKRAKHSAMLFTNGVRVTNLFDSEFYYAKYIKPPKWSKNMKKEAQIGQHIFFSDKTKLANAEEFE